MPYDEYDVDLRPLGYDAGLTQTNPQKPLISPYISVYRRFDLAQRWALQPELSLSQKGVDFSYSIYEDIIYKIKISYLEIPLSFSYQYLQKENLLSHFTWEEMVVLKLKKLKKSPFII
jgi:hypothetical protein